MPGDGGLWVVEWTDLSGNGHLKVMDNYAQGQRLCQQLKNEQVTHKTRGGGIAKGPTFWDLHGSGRGE